jgi:outer membrane protein
MILSIATGAGAQTPPFQPPPATALPHAQALGLAQPTTPPGRPPLTLKDAEDLALKNHPLVLAAQRDVAASGQALREVRAAFYPTLTGELTGSQGNDNARIGAGTLAASRLFDRFGQGVIFSQLITDSGRTPSLVASSKAQEQSRAQTYQATREEVLLGVTTAYFGLLRAQGLVRVAQQTVTVRQLLFDQVNTLAQNNLRSQLDVNFAEVNLADAKLLLLSAQGAEQAADANLTRALGADQPVTYQPVEEPLPAGPPSSADALIAQAFTNRPELAALRFDRESAHRFADAERDLTRPTVGLVGVAGFLPFVNQEGSTPIPDKYEGVAVNVSVPVLNGGLYAARHNAALFRAMEADQRLRDAEERITRDVRVAWADATTGFQRLDVTAQFLRAAALAMDLAQGRYNLGLASIVELTQAQLNLTRAEIENLSAKYDYQHLYAALQYSLGLLR